MTKHDLIRRTLQPLVAEDDRLRGEEETLAGKLADLKDERKTIRRLLRDGGLIEAESSNGKPKKAKPTPAYVSDATLDLAREAIVGFSGGEFTRRDLAEAMGSADATAKNAIEALREVKEIRLVGQKVPAGNTARVKAAHYAAIA